MTVATVLALVGIGVAHRLYKDGPQGAEPVVRRLGPLPRIVENKFYVDELYNFLFVRPFRYAARKSFEILDRIFIDGILVGAWGFIVSVFGRAARAIQNGDVQRYLIVMLLGLAAIFYFGTCQRDSFVATPKEGTTVSFVANLGDGVQRRGARTEWDFDGDGKIDATRPEATWTFTAPGTYPVILKITDVFGRTEIIKRSVTVGK